MTTTISRARRTLIALIGVIVVASPTTACDSSSDATRPVDSSASSTAATGQADRRRDLPRNGAPEVPRPIGDIARFERDPCSLPAAEQLAKLDFDPYRVTPNHEDGGPGCCSYSQLGVIEAHTTIGTHLPDGLSGLYAEKPEFDLFEPTDPIEGHPTVIADLNDRRAQGRCAVFVGLHDDLTYRTIVEAEPTTRAGRQPCKFAADLTVLALHAMNEGGQ